MDIISMSDQTSIARDERGPRRPSALTLSSIGSTGIRSAESSPTRTRFPTTTESSSSLTIPESNDTVQKGPFVFVGPERKRYHAERVKAPYPLPCGLEELSRLNLLHYVYYNIFGQRHYLTEFPQGELPRRVLDIGCGTGIWIYDVAKEWRERGHAGVEFVGVDLVPIQTPMRDVNVKYHHLNILTEELPFEDGYFDYVHIRGIAGGIPEECWLGDHKTASGILDKAIRVLRVGGYFEVMEMFSYFDTSVNPPRPLPPEIVFNKDDTIAPILSKVYTGRQLSSSTQELGINPLPLSILSAQMTFLPLTNLHTERSWMPVSRYDVPLLRTDQSNGSSNDEEPKKLKDSVAQVSGYIATADTWLALRPELVRVLQSQYRGDAYNEIRRMERRSHQRWLGMSIEKGEHERPGSVLSDYDSVRKTYSGESSMSKSGLSEKSTAESVSGDQTQQSTPTASQPQSSLLPDKVEMRKEVGAWWGKKTAD